MSRLRLPVLILCGFTAYTSALEPFSTVAGGAALLSAGYHWWKSKQCGFDSAFKDKFDRYIEDHVFGQHIAALVIPPEMRAHLDSFRNQNAGKSKALALSFHGGTGTGKTYVSTFTEMSLFNGKAHKHLFSGTEFQDPTQVHAYRVCIAETIRKMTAKCPYALFVFLDSHLIAPGVLDVLVSFLEFGAEDINGLDYSKAIYIFQSNQCDKHINEAVMTHMKTGEMRSQLEHARVEQILQACLSSEGSMDDTVLFEKGLVYRVPFLPLTRAEVLQCATVCLKDLREQGQALGKWQGLYWNSDVVHFVVDKMRFLGPISTSGCKTISQKVRTYLEGPLSRVNRKERQCTVDDRKEFARQGWFSSMHQEHCYVHHQHSLTLSLSASGRVCIRVQQQRSLRESARESHQEEECLQPT